MSSRRTVILIAAVMLGAFAALGLLNYVRNAETGSGEAGAPVEVWVARQSIPKGTPIEDALEQDLLGTLTVAEKLVPPTVVTDPSNELAGLIAVADLPVNMTIVHGMFVSPIVLKTGITDRLEERGLVTVTVSVDQVRGAAMLIEPGDFVNVMIERRWSTPFFEAEPEIDLTEEARAILLAELEANDTTRPIISDVFQVDTRFVYQKAEVLAVGERLTPEPGQTASDLAAGGAQEAQTSNIITLAVPPEAAQVILNVGRDNLYLSLVPDDYQPRPILPLDPTTQVLPGEVDGQLTPYEGIEGVDNPAADASSLAFDETGAPLVDSENRIGTPAGSGSSTSEAPPATTPAPTESTTTIAPATSEAPADLGAAEGN